MNKKQKINVHLYLNKQKAKNDQFALYIRLRIDGTLATISTGRFVSSALWDSHKEKVKGSNPVAHSMNAYIDKIYFVKGIKL